MNQKYLGQAAAAISIGVALAFAGSHQGQELGGWKLFGVLVALAFIINWAAYIPSYLAQTEHFYDLVGSLTYQLLAIMALVLVDTRDTRTVLLGVMILVWAVRLGSFLFIRVRKAGKDGRFDKIKTNWARFLMAWTTQALWITFTAGAALAAMTSGKKSDIGVLGIIGAALWLAGFAIEVVADQQKSVFKANGANDGRFISSGLWSWSRHPNYFGETLLWTGVALIALPVLQGWQYATLVSPVLVYLLLNKASGVPMLERRADKKWGGQADYEKYKANTPVFFLKPPST